MALIVEDGTIVAGAESYITVTAADTYHANRGNSAWAALTTEQKEQALRKSTDYMVQVYRLRWKGTRVSAAQTLDWPRAMVVRDDYEYTGLNGYTTIGGNSYYPSNEVPQEVKYACAEVGLRSISGDLAPDVGRLKKRTKVDVLEVEYADYASPYTQYRAIDNLLAPFMNGATGGASHKVIRA